MNNFLKVTIGSAILAIIVAFTSYSPASAEAKSTQIYEYSFEEDLDGNGKKEEIYTKTVFTIDNWEFEYVYSVDVSINGKSVFSETLENNACIYNADVYVVDINSKDKYKELIVELGDEFSCDQRAYRYKKKKLNLLFDTGWISFDNGMLAEQNADKNVLMSARTITNLGNNLNVITNNKITKKKLKEIKPKNGIYTVLNGSDFTYILAKDADIYTKSDGKKVKTTLKKGTGFYITGLKRVKDEFTYARIRLEDGKKDIGWLDLTQHSYEDELVTTTYFAG